MSDWMMTRKPASPPCADFFLCMNSRTAHHAAKLAAHELTLLCRFTSWDGAQG